MAEFDQKNRAFYDELTDEERKKFSTYLMLRWGSAVQTNNTDLQKYYIISMNEQANKHFWSLGKHPKLQWLLLTTVSPGMGKFRHEWIAYKGKQAKNKRAKLLGNFYPEIKTNDLEMMSDIMTDQQFKTLLADHGWDDKQIKEAMK